MKINAAAGSIQSFWIALEQREKIWIALEQLERRWKWTNWARQLDFSSLLNYDHDHDDHDDHDHDHDDHDGNNDADCDEIAMECYSGTISYI